jgi:Txe/YoeB family toxin of Txe-Axe toxin-antitoxin module
MKNKVSIISISLIVILTLSIILFSVYTQKLLYNDSAKLEKSIDEIIQSTKSQSWEQAENKMHQLNKDWQEIKGTWSSLIDHQEIDNIDITISRLQILIETKDISSSTSEAAALKKYVNHIPEKENLTIDNIF